MQGKCKVSTQLSSEIQDCLNDYDLFSEDKQNYNFSWTDYSPHADAERTQPGAERIYKSFLYRHSDELDGLPYYGKFNLYYGGGYVYELRGQLAYLKGNLSRLEQLAWIDKQTVAVLVEFSLYNPNINLFSYSTLLFEYLPTGNLIITARFDIMSLFAQLAGDDMLMAGIGLAYMAMIVYFMLRECFNVYKLKRAYFKRFWSYVQWSLVAFSWAAFAIYLYKYYTGERLKAFFKQTSGFGYVKLQEISYWNDLLTCFLALVACLGTLKFIKLLRHNITIVQLVETFRKSFAELAGISAMFLNLFLAFLQILYLFYNEKTPGFATLVSSMETCFQILLGKFDVRPLLESNALLGPLVFSGYNIAVLFVILSIFVTVLSDSYISAKSDVDGTEYETDLVEFVRNKWGEFYERRLKAEKRGKRASRATASRVGHESYRQDANQHEKLTARINVLVNRLEKVGFIFVIEYI